MRYPIALVVALSVLFSAVAAAQWVPAAPAPLFSWTAPTERANGDPLTPAELATYFIHCDGMADVAVDASVTRYKAPPGAFPPGDYSCSVSVEDTDGRKSARSDVVKFSVVQPPPIIQPPAPPGDFRVDFLSLGEP